MIKGAQLKSEVTQKILSTFSGSFLYDGKEIRINGSEDGLPLQIKLTLTTAKTPVEANGVATDFSSSEDSPIVVSKEKTPNEPTEEEKARLEKLLQSLNLN